MTKKTVRYQKPKIKAKKIKQSFFLTNRRFFDSLDALLVPQVFASGPGHCFLPGTKILMGDHSYKEIQDVKVGETVITYDLKTKSYTEEKVTKLFVHPFTGTGYLFINNLLKATGNHPLWINNRSSWQPAKALKVGDTLLDKDGNTVKINSIKQSNGIHTVYNLETEGINHNYFAENLLVHNKSIP